VIKKAIERWRLSKEIEPGHRFQTRYSNHRRHRQRGETSKHRKLFNLVGGPTLIVAGIAFLPTPGPSFIIIVIGMWMLAGEYLPLARFLDRLDARQRELKRWIKGRWSRLPPISKVVAVLMCAVVLEYGACYLCFGG
jgi:Flp pilus assembly protein TadB